MCKLLQCNVKSYLKYVINYVINKSHLIFGVMFYTYAQYIFYTYYRPKIRTAVNGQFRCPKNNKYQMGYCYYCFYIYLLFFSQQAALRGFLVILALSLHAVFEGIALGLTKTSNGAWFLFFAISCHKYVISFCIGMQFISSGKMEKKPNYLYLEEFFFIGDLFQKTTPSTDDLCVYFYFKQNILEIPLVLQL